MKSAEQKGSLVGMDVEFRYKGGWFSAAVLSHRDGSVFVQAETDRSLHFLKEAQVRRSVPAPVEAQEHADAGTMAAAPPKQPLLPVVAPEPPLPPKATPEKKKRPPVPDPPSARPRSSSGSEGSANLLPSAYAVARASSPANAAAAAKTVGSPVGVTAKPHPSSHARNKSMDGTASLDSLSPNQRRKQYQANAVGTDSVVKNVVKDLVLYPTDPACRFDLDDLTPENMVGNIRSLRVGLFGDCGVGKSALAKVLAGGAFEESLPPTVFDTLKHSVRVCAEQKEVPMEFWDVSGSDRYAKKRPVIYPNVNAFCVCFDLNDRYSFNNSIKIWLAEVASACQGLPVFFVATKSDKGTASIKQSEIEFAMRNTAVASLARPFLYVETSAKNRKFVDDLFVKVVYSVLFDCSKVEQKKGPGIQAAQKLAQLEEMRRAQKPPALPSKPVAVPPPPRLGKTNSSAELSRSSGTISAATRAPTATASPPKSDFERQFDAIHVSAPTGFRHLRSAADILKEFDPDFASKQKRPAAIPIVGVFLVFRFPCSARLFSRRRHRRRCAGPPEPEPRRQ